MIDSKIHNHGIIGCTIGHKAVYSVTLTVQGPKFDKTRRPLKSSKTFEFNRESMSQEIKRAKQTNPFLQIRFQFHFGYSSTTIISDRTNNRGLQYNTEDGKDR